MHKLFVKNKTHASRIVVQTTAAAAGVVRISYSFAFRKERFG